MAIPKFTLRLADGTIARGAIQGCGGILNAGVANANRLRAQIRLANDGRALGIYEPKPGHCRMYPKYSAKSNGKALDVDLRGAELVAFTESDEAMNDTLSSVLFGLGYTHEPADNGTRDILKDGARVFTGTADATWHWLRRRGEWTEPCPSTAADHYCHACQEAA